MEPLPERGMYYHVGGRSRLLQGRALGEVGIRFLSGLQSKPYLA